MTQSLCWMIGQSRFDTYGLEVSARSIVALGPTKSPVYSLFLACFPSSRLAKG